MSEKLAPNAARYFLGEVASWLLGVREAEQRRLPA